MRAPNPNFSDATLASNSMTAHSARILIRLTVLPLCLALPLSSQAQDNNQLDWSPIEAVPEALRDVQCERCEGRYIDPLADVDTSAPPEEQEIQGTGNDHAHNRFPAEVLQHEKSPPVPSRGHHQHRRCCEMSQRPAH